MPTPQLRLRLVLEDQAVGEVIASEHTWTFDNVDAHISVLQKLWDRHLEEYEMREEDLRADAEDAANSEKEYLEKEGEEV